MNLALTASPKMWPNYSLNIAISLNIVIAQGRSQSAEKIKYIKGRLLDQVVIIFNCVPFRNGNFSQTKAFAPRGSEFFPLRAVSYTMENHFYHIR